jgi:hemerythrin-like domain-containing protein
MGLASLAQLERCHRRHDEVMLALLASARRIAAGRPEAGDVAAVKDAIAYFERSVTRHFLDEEGSVFPRLSTRRPELAETLAQLSAEHPTQIALQQQIAAAAEHLDDKTRQNGGKAILELAEKLAELHRVHVEREDKVFAEAEAALTPEDDTEIVAEMETRRDRDGDRGRGRGTGGGKKKARLTRTRPAAKAAAKSRRAPKPKAKPKAKPKHGKR